MSESENLQKHTVACMRMAAECRSLAADVHEPDLRAHLLRLASMWTELAHQPHELRNWSTEPCTDLIVILSAGSL
jgi:hypothetical protein